MKPTKLLPLITGLIALAQLAGAAELREQAHLTFAPEVPPPITRQRRRSSRCI